MESKEIAGACTGAGASAGAIATATAKHRTKKARVQTPSVHGNGPTNRQQFEQLHQTCNSLKTELSLVKSELTVLKAVLALANLQPMNPSGLNLHDLEGLYNEKVKAFQNWHKLHMHKGDK